MKPLNIDVRQWGQPEGILDNIKYSLSLNLPELGINPIKHSGTFVICGSGSSFPDHIEEIRQDQKNGMTICAIKGTHDYLMEHGIHPDCFLSVEPRYRPIKRPSKHTVYLLSSRVHKQLFDDLRAAKTCIYLWHSWSSEDEADGLLKNRVQVGGGTTSGLRAINVAYLLGFRNFKLYGMDSCLNEKGEKRFHQGPIDRSVSKTDVIVAGRRFTCNMAMAAQAQDFQYIWDVMPDAHVDVVGDGLLAAIMQERKKLNLKT